MKNAAIKQTLPQNHATVAADDEPGNQEAYAEYLRGFDDIPVLQDAVRVPPPRRRQPDFRRGERRDVRKEPRADAYTLRESKLAELDGLYDEYCRPVAAPPPKPKKGRKRKGKAKPR